MTAAVATAGRVVLALSAKIAIKGGFNLRIDNKRSIDRFLMVNKTVKSDRRARIVATACTKHRTS